MSDVCSSDLDDEFAQDVSEFDTLDEYRADIKARLEKEAQQAADKKYENDIVKKAVDNAEVLIPDVMVERQLDNILKRLEMSLRYQGMELKNYLDMMGMEEETLRNEYRDKALQDVKTQLVLEKISAEEQVDATEEEIEAEIAETAEKYKQSKEDFKKHLKNDDIEYIKDTVITNKTIQLMMA
jgi:trigger factor